MLFIGELAALATSVAWTFTSTFFTIAGKLVGSPLVNRTRLLVGLTFVVLAHWVTQGVPLPLDAEPFRWAWLALSALLGFVVADTLLFQAFVLIGARLSMLVLSLSPIFGALIAWALLGETLSGREALGVGLAVAGVTLVVARPERGMPQAARDQLVWGALLALGAAATQAAGLVFSKVGIEGDFPALSGNAIRLLTATAIMWTVAIARRRAVAGFVTLRENPRAAWAIVGGSFAGPFLGVTLSLFAVQRAPVGVASTLMSLPPVFLLPVGRLWFNERVGWVAILGTGLAFAGTALLFLQG